jgi:spermidine synthase
MSGNSNAEEGRYAYAVIGLVACSMLIHEILLTRICALRLYFHFAFLVISNCLLGLGASGTLLALKHDAWRAEPRKWIGRFSVAYVASLVVTYALLLRYPLPEDLKLSDPANLATFSVFNLIGAVPFVFGGTVVGMILSFDVPRANRLYGTDLVGAGLGCIACPALLTWYGAGGVFIVTVLLALAASVVALRRALGWRALAAGGALGALGLALLPSLDRRFPVPTKALVEYAIAIEAKEGLGERYSIWTANSRIDLMRNPKGSPLGIFMRGENTDGLPPGPESAGIAQDAMAGTTIVNFSEHPEALAILKRCMYSTAYRQKVSPRVLVIGLGGGNDVWAAKAHGARSVKAIELNWPIVDIHKKVLRHFSRALVEDPTIELVVDEGRSALMRETGPYDVIQMSGIDTWTALASGAYVLAENYLYTQEAIVSMYRLLAEGGILQIARFAEDMEALRLLSNVNAAFEKLGVSNLSRRVVLLSTSDKMLALQVKKGEFTVDDEAAIAEAAERDGINVVYLPHRTAGLPIEDFIRSSDMAGFIETFPMNVTPTTDDKPYFFNYAKWRHPIDSIEHMHDVPSVSQGNPFFLLSQLAVSIVLSLLLIVVPIARRGGVPRQGSLRYFVFFAGLGLGFISVEVAVIQKLTLFLGEPVYSLTVTLFSLLVFTGVGSLALAGRFRADDRRVWAIPALLVVYLISFRFVATFLVAHFIVYPLTARIVIAALVLSPLGILLGFPFAFGLRVLAEKNPRLLPWAWAINGCLSVVGSILTVIVSMNFGFSAVLAVAAVVYVAAFASLLAGRHTLAQPIA